MESFWNDLHYEDIHFRDNLQFELESDFAPISALREQISTQEFYFFIPSSLQINKDTYSKEQFYKDRTNLIRYKSPEFSFLELIDKTNQQSPLNRLINLKISEKTESNLLMAQDELKLLGNVVRSALRASTRGVLDHLRDPQAHIDSELQVEVLVLCKEIIAFRKAFWELQSGFGHSWDESIEQDFLYVDEFISRSIDYYLTGFLAYLRHSKIENIHEIDHEVCEIIAVEKKHRQKQYREPEKLSEGERFQENILHHKSLLNKYVLDALLLRLERTSWVERYGGLVATLATGLAMLLYVLFFFFHVADISFNSIPFLVFTVVLYVLRDRMKEGLKTMFHQQAYRLFSDYTTQIWSSSDGVQIGRLKEFFSFVAEKDLPQDISQTREEEFESDLIFFKQPEEIFYYKKEMILVSSEALVKARRHKLHNTFLFNVHLLLEKASNPADAYLHLDLDTMEIIADTLPKVYYINIIMKNTFVQPDLQTKVEMKKFRIVIDKNGIKRVEAIH